MLTLLIFIVVLGVIVFVHEFGHFIAAKRSGCGVEEFGFGFPPRMFGIKRGETLYSVNWIPIGGFVKIKGETGDDRNDPKSFSSKPIWKRAIILLAGVTMNVVLAIVLLTAGYAIGVPTVVDEVPAGAILSNRAVAIVEVIKDSPADKGGIKPGDQVLSASSAKINSTQDLQNITKASNGPIEITVKRNSEEKTLTVTPEVLKETNTRGIGVQLADTATVRFPLHLALVNGVKATGSYTSLIATSFGTIIKNIFVGKGLPSDISGPVGIAVMTGQATRLGFMYLLQFTAILSLNLAVVNAVPFPALDGGRVLFLIIEKIRRKPVPQKAENIAHQIGFALLMLLIVAVTYKDLINYGGNIVGFVKRIF